MTWVIRANSGKLHAARSPEARISPCGAARGEPEAVTFATLLSASRCRTPACSRLWPEELRGVDTRTLTAPPRTSREPHVHTCRDCGARWDEDA